jgi:hypothetical protein
MERIRVFERVIQHILAKSVTEAQSDPFRSRRGIHGFRLSKGAKFATSIE